MKIKMKKETIVIIIFVVMILALMVFVNKETSTDYKMPFSKEKETDNETNFTEDHNMTNGTGGFIGDGSGTNGAGGGSGVGTTPDNETEPLPEDINQSECGIYYKRYGVCAGTCPDGECVLEGRSCFCQEDNESEA